MSCQIPRVGVGIIVFNGQKLLLGKRLSKHGQNTWALPGGHLEFEETPEECAKRELFEETNLVAQNIQRGPYINYVDKSDSSHYVSLITVVHNFSGSLENKEPNKCQSWEWFDIDDLPSPLFTPLKSLVDNSTLHSLKSDIHEVAYLASPYNHKDPSIKQRRLDSVTKVAAMLHLNGIFVFSPLTHNISLVDHGVIQDWETWGKFDLSMVKRCSKLFVLQLPGWEESIGVTAEIEFSKKHNIPVEYIPNPEDVDINEFISKTISVQPKCCL